jgi:hypothetical protein
MGIFVGVSITMWFYENERMGKGEGEEYKIN